MTVRRCRLNVVLFLAEALNYVTVDHGLEVKYNRLWNWRREIIVCLFRSSNYDEELKIQILKEDHKEH